MSRQPAHSSSASAGLKPAPSGPCPSAHVQVHCPCPGHFHLLIFATLTSSTTSPHHFSLPPLFYVGLEIHVYEANQQWNMATLPLLKATHYWPSKRNQCCFVMVLLPPASKWWYMGAPVINVVPDVPQTAPATTCPSSSTKTEFPHCTLVQLYLRRTSVCSYPTSPSSDCNHDSKTKRSASNPQEFLLNSTL